MERRDQLLSAAAQVYARHGYRGSTTRRIADAAGVNEVTIFRQFGSKDALIHEAIATCGGGPPVPDLPSMPTDPMVELTSWCQAVMQQLVSTKSLIRRCMSERDEHPQLSTVSSSGSTRASSKLRAYLLRLREQHFVDDTFDVTGATAMLMGALFADAMGRDAMPEIFPQTPAAAAESYSMLLLRAIGVHEHSSTN